MQQTSHKVTFAGFKCMVLKRSYTNGRVALELVEEMSGEPVAVASVNLPDAHCPAGYVFIKDWSENSGILKVLVEAGVIEQTNVRVATGFVEAIMCRLLV